ncbi:MAG TPA: LapA family protein [Syntrophales bacterium]|nr:LapA family protein [Syntrophales bacterium]HPQ45174.1 LapA family protein [Syntrophales bacterium]
MNVKLILALVLAGLVVLFIIQNVTVVEIRFLFWTLSMSRALLMFFVLTVGVVIGWSLHSFSVTHRKPDDE